MSLKKKFLEISQVGIEFPTPEGPFCAEGVVKALQTNPKNDIESLINPRIKYVEWYTQA